MVNDPTDPQRGGAAGVFTYGFELQPLRCDQRRADRWRHRPPRPAQPAPLHRQTPRQRHRQPRHGRQTVRARRRPVPSRDRYLGALADLGLTFDALTGNRYALAAGNPISYVEHDGRTVIPNGAGGATTSANPGATDSWFRTGGSIAAHR